MVIINFTTIMVEIDFTIATIGDDNNLTFIDIRSTSYQFNFYIIINLNLFNL